MVEKISLLGSTGSIGVQTLKIAKFLKLGVVALAANENIELLEQQAREFKPEVVCVFNEKSYIDFKKRVFDCNFKIVTGMEGLCEVAAWGSANLTVNAVVGTNGLLPTLTALDFKKNVAMANKEAIVIGGNLIANRAHQRGCKILPIDSEHSAIFQCLEQANLNRVSKVFLTASGGPFFGKTRLELEHVTLNQALNHPKWKMGKKISIDSATLMNKGLELIEACHLFGLSADLIEIIIHPQASLHSAVAYVDGAVIGQFGAVDMMLPIQFALTWPKRASSMVAPFSFVDCGELNFFKPDFETFGCLKLCVEAAKIGGWQPCIVHAANEQAVELFLNEQIKFLQIEELIFRATKLDLNKLFGNFVEADVAQILKVVDYVKAFVKEQAEILI